MTLVAAADTRSADWIPESLHGFAQDVGSVVPPVFEAYARIFHPAWLDGPDGRSVSWAEVAAANGRVVHPAMQFHALVPAGSMDPAGNVLNPQPGLWDSAPEQGSLDEEMIEALIPVLRARTTTPDLCWFAFWNGWGTPSSLAPGGIGAFGFLRPGDSGPVQPPAYDLDRDRFLAPVVRIPQRELLLFSGTLDDALESYYRPYGDFSFQSAYFWWPDDRAWVVATEIDLMSTYVGAATECVDAIVATEGIEALRIQIDEGITGASDAINPNPFAGA